MTDGKRARVTPPVVQDMRADHRAGMSQAAIARKYGVSYAQTTKILNYLAWGNVPDIPSEGEVNQSVGKLLGKLQELKQKDNAIEGIVQSVVNPLDE